MWSSPLLGLGELPTAGGGGGGGGGIGTGDLVADGTFDRKEDKLLRERSSAKWLALVGIYADDNSKLKEASMKNRQRSMCISRGCLLVLERRTATTA